MKKTKPEIPTFFRNLKQRELYECRGGLCYFPVWLGQKLGEKIVDLFRTDKT